MQRILFLLIISLATLGLHAQTDYRPGYIITLSGDTVYGKIDYRGDYTMGHICRFEAKDGVKSEYTPDNIQAYRFTDSKYYVSKTIDGKKYFLEYLIKGKMDIYYLRNDTGDHYYVDKEGNRMIEIPYTEDIRWIEGKEYRIVSKKHVGILEYLTQDAPQLKNKIDKITEPNHWNLTQVAKAYHNAVCEDDEQCTIFERPLPLFKLQAEPVLGYYTWLRQRDDVDKFGITPGFVYGGVNLYAWLPRTNENLYFKTGVVYTHPGPSDLLDMSNLFIVPLQLSYLYPTGKFRPTFSGGINLYILDGWEVDNICSYSVGLWTQLNNKNAITINLGLETLPLFFIIPSHHLVGFSTSIGFRHTF